MNDGLLQSQVLSICQDDRGYLWIGTADGICKYDGFSFEQPIINNEPAVEGAVYSILQDKNRNIWIGTGNGAIRYDGLNYHRIDEKVLPTGLRVSCLYETGDTIWFGTEKGVILYAENNFEIFKPNSILHHSDILSVYNDNKGRLWFGTLANGLIKYDKSGVHHYTKTNGLNFNIVRTICGDPNGNIIAGTDKGLNIYIENMPENTICFSSLSLTENITITSSYINNDNTIWFGSYSGLIKCYPENNFRIVRYSTDNGLHDNEVLVVTKDSEKNLWIGMDGGGISKLAGEGFIHLDAESGILPENEVWAIYNDSRYNIWFGTRNKGAVRISSGQVNNIIYNKTKNVINKGIKYYLHENNIWRIKEDKDGGIWFCSTYAVYHLQTGHIKKYPVPGSYVYSILKDTRGIVWLGTNSGILQLSNDSTHKISISDEYDMGMVFHIYEDNSRNIWFSGRNGLFKFDGKSLIHFTENDGFTDKKVTVIIEDQKSNYWIATENGLYHFDNNNFIKIRDNQGKDPGNIYSMLLDHKQNLWMGTSNGVYMSNISDYNQKEPLNIYHYDNSDGFMGIECNLNAVCEDDHGRIWFGTVNGITIIDPEKINFNRSEPNTIISGIKLFFKDIDWSQYSGSFDSLTGLPQNLVLPHDKNHLTFSFTGIHHTRPQGVKYQYKLKGFDNDWSPVSKENKAIYTNIPGGGFIFQVRSCNLAGVWNKQPTEFAFTIKPPFYQTKEFYFFSILLTVSLFYLIYFIRTRSLKKAKIRLENEVESRTAELRIINNELFRQKEIVEHKNKDITASINYASRIQTSLLIPEEEIYSLFPQSFILFMPRDIVSGDFYWAARKNGCLLIAAADCTGHGVPGAFMSILGNSFLNEIVQEKGIVRPNKVLDILRKRVTEALQNNKKDIASQDGMDIALCSVENNILRFAGAVNPLYLIRKKKLYKYAGDKAPVGYSYHTDVTTYTEHSIELQKGDTVYMFSDGYADQFSGSNGTAANENGYIPQKKFSRQRFRELLLTIQDNDIRKQKKTLKETIEKWRGDCEQIDDILVIGIRF